MEKKYYSMEKWPELYLDYVNNFLTVETFAEWYQMSLRLANDIIDVGHATDNFTKPIYLPHKQVTKE